jgi:hypothetical protein
MDHFADRPLDRPDLTGPAGAPPRPPRHGALLLVATLGLIAGAGAAWWWTRTDRQQAVVSAPTRTDAVVAEETEPTRMLPPLGQMDTFLRALLGALSAHPDFARWLATDDLIRQMASGIDRISRGQSPAADLLMLRPPGDFAVSRQRGVTYLDPASFQRFDRLAALVDSLEARGVAEAYRTIQPRLDEAYRALGRTEGGVDAAIDAALQQLIDTPVVSDPIALVPGRGATYAFRDPALERLTPMQKQLVRMGPENVQRIQTRLRAIRAALASSDNRAR